VEPRLAPDLLMARSAIRDGLVKIGIPQVNVDMLNSRYTMAEVDVMMQEQFNQWFESLPQCFYEIVNEGGVPDIEKSYANLCS
jgi:hypothetical protein